MAKAGYGTKFQTGDGGGSEVFTDVANVLDINPAESSTNVIDVTAHDSADSHREFIAGLIDAGEFQVQLAFESGATGHSTLRTQRLARTVNNYRIVLPGSDLTLQYAAIITSEGIQTPLDDKIVQTFGFKVTGKPTLS